MNHGRMDPADGAAATCTLQGRPQAAPPVSLDGGSPYQLKASPFSSHGQILAMAGSFPRQTRILDVGAASGYLGASLRRIGFGSLSGIETDPQLAAQARSWYDTLLVGDVEQARWSWPPSSFELVICADILEHLRDPQETLGRLRALLTPTGWMIVSLPNVAHWSVRLMLLAGRFPYASRGILDRTHLRFFTRQSARTLLETVGLPVRREAVTPLPFTTWQPHSRWRGWWERLEGVDWALARLRPTLCAYQLLFLCQRRG